MNKPELLLPVGNYKMCLAAIHNGADAIYLGMPSFNARGRSYDHDFSEFKEIIDTCHLYGVKVNVAFNILIFQNEFNKAMDVLDQVISLGPDAFIVQDLGLVRLMKECYPQVVIHGSTQMSVTNHEAISLLSDLNIKRFVLGRENTIEEIKIIKENTDKELEVFVHGALCVAYSGQCFTSESLGGRSANRGQCAQSCRFEYDLYVDGKKQKLGVSKYLVSPQDLCGIDEIPKLLEIGVDSYKVEGRLKSPEFVASVARSYRSVIDGTKTNNEKLKDEMQITYSRGFYSGWLGGVAHQELVEGSFSSHRGLLIGEVLKVCGAEIYCKINKSVTNGDGLLFAISDEKKYGEKIYHVRLERDLTVVTMGPGIDTSLIFEGARVYLNRRESLIKELSKSYSQRELLKRIPLKIHLEGVSGKKLSVSADDGTNVICLESDLNCESALNTGLSQSTLFDAFKGLSHSPYKLESLSFNSDSCLFIHNRELKALKQRMVEKLNEVRVHIGPIIKNERHNFIPVTQTPSLSSKLNILIRSIDQLAFLEDYFKGEGKSLKKFVGQIICDYEFGKDYFSSIKRIKELNLTSAIATTRVLKPSEYHNFKLIERANPDAIITRNLGALNYFKDSKFKLHGDFSLNCANSQTFDYLISKGLESITASYDLNHEQLGSMMEFIDTSKLEITIHQYMPEFHMEHCVFAAFMSEGNSFRDCGKPCEKHKVHLTDMFGNRSEIKADQECRNTMFKSEAQSVVKFIDDWRSKGVGLYRFEALDEDAIALCNKVDSYLKLLAQVYTIDDVYKRIGTIEKYGMSAGPMSIKKEYRSRKKEVLR